MAYVDIGAVAAEATILVDWGNQVRANFQAGVPDIFTTKGDLAVATGADEAARLAAGADDSIVVYDSSQATGMATQIIPACRVYNDANIDPTPDTWVSLTFNSERVDTNAMHSTASNTSRLTVPTGGTGLYLIGGNVEFDTSGETSGEIPMGVRILLNGATVIASDYRTQSTHDGAEDSRVSITTMYSLAATNYLELQAWVGSNVNILVTGNYSPEFWATWIRRA